MAKDDIEWILIKKFNPEPIGAIGFIDGQAAVIASFYDDRDGDSSGDVSWGEAIMAKLSPISLEGKAVTEVAMQARYNLDVIAKDASFAQAAVAIWLNFARGLILDGIYTVYFARGVKMAGSGLAKTVTKGMVKELIVRKGFEKAAKTAFESAVSR